MTRKNDGANAKGAELPSSMRPSYHHRRRDQNHHRRSRRGGGGRSGNPGPVEPVQVASSSNSSSPSFLLPRSSSRSTTIFPPNSLYGMSSREFANTSLRVPSSSSTTMMLTDNVISSLFRGGGGGHPLPERVVNHDTPRSSRLPYGGGERARRINDNSRVRGTLEIIQSALDLVNSSLEEGGSLLNVPDPCAHHVGNHDRLQ